MGDAWRSPAPSGAHKMIYKINPFKYLTTPWLIMGLLIVILLAGCAPKSYQDVINSVSSEQLLSPEGEYKSVAWLDQDHIAFIYRPMTSTSQEPNDNFRVGVFEISTSTTKELNVLPATLDCYSGQSELSNLSKLPNGSLGFILHCKPGNYSLYIIDPDSEKIKKWQTYPRFDARSFSFSPDMTQLIQENGSGGGLSEKLLLVSSDKTMKELLPDFQRARSPAWSSNGEMIIFAGTRNNAEDFSITTSKDIESLFFYPWDIYVMDADGSNPEILLPSVGTIYGLNWSPTNENILLFGGSSFDNVDGVWLLNISDLSVMRIWNKNTNFDWSPDGSQVVLLDDKKGVWWGNIKVLDISNVFSLNP